MSSLLSELSRRNVFRVAAAYVVVAWLVLQVSSVLFVTFEAPGWVAKVFTALIFLGFPVTLIISWAFERTPDGIIRTEPGAAEGGKVPTADLVLVGLLVVVVGSYIAGDLRTQPSQQGLPDQGRQYPVTSAADGRVTIAVLPFTNMSSDKEQDYFSDGITEEILNALAHAEGLKVTSRTSSFAVKGSTDDLPTIARKLGVDHILEGSVRLSGGTLRVTAQLIRAVDDAHLWSQTWDRELKDIFLIQEELSHAIAMALRVKLIKSDEQAVEVDPQVYDLYLRALDNIARTSFADMNLAIERLEQVIEAEPNFARAHSALARAISFSLLTGSVKGELWLDRLDKAGHEALARDNQSVDVYGSFATSAYVRGDLRWAIDTFAHAERLGALGIWDHFSYANALIDRGEIGEADRMAKAGIASEPLNISTYFGQAMASAAAGDTKAGLSALTSARELVPDNPNAYYFSIMMMTAQGGDLGRAMTFADKAYELDAIDPEIQTLHALHHLSLGQYRKAEKWIEEALGNDPDIGFALGVKGLILAAQGKTEAARILALRALDPGTGATSFRFGGNNMLVSLAWPDARRGAWSEGALQTYQRHWPQLFQFNDTGHLWASTQAAIVSPPALAAADYIAWARAEGADVEARQMAAWVNDNITPTMFWTFTNNGLALAEIAMLEGDQNRALEIIEAEVAEGFIMCWQWRLRDNPHFGALGEHPRFRAALEGVARNIRTQKASYEALRTNTQHTP